MYKRYNKSFFWWKYIALAAVLGQLFFFSFLTGDQIGTSSKSAITKMARMTPQCRVLNGNVDFFYSSI
jgi:hypothetical protein